MLATNLIVLKGGYFQNDLLTIAYPYHFTTLETLHTITALSTVTTTIKIAHIMNSPLFNFANCSLTSSVFGITKQNRIDQSIMG